MRTPLEFYCGVCVRNIKRLMAPFSAAAAGGGGALAVEHIGDLDGDETGRFFTS
jgi:hypothetical protein